MVMDGVAENIDNKVKSTMGTCCNNEKQWSMPRKLLMIIGVLGMIKLAS